jgi:hypothetical protein
MAARSLVVEVRYDHFTGGRFRHGTKVLRWRPDKPPRQCTMDQVEGRWVRTVARSRPGSSERREEGGTVWIPSMCIWR